MSATKILADHVSSIRYETLSEEVVQKTKATILDTLGCAIAGFTLASDEISPLLHLIMESGGRPEATIIGSGNRTSCLNAALVNSSMTHTIDYDDTHVPSLAHFGCCTVPAAIALGEKIDAGGAEIIAAVVAGFEAASKVARSVMPSHYSYWHSTATNGVIAAAATVANLLKFNSEKTEMTLGMAADQAAGSRYCLDYGDFTKSLHPGMAAFNGMLAGLLIQRGSIGPKDFFDYDKGYCNVYSDEPHINMMTENLGSPYEIMINDIKGFPTILCSHTPVQATLKLVEENHLQASDIEKIVVKMVTLPKGQGCNYNPDTPMAARLSIPYCVALAIIDRAVQLEYFEMEKIHDPRIRELMGKITIYPDPELDTFKPDMPAVVEITDKKGRHFELKSLYPKGSVKNPMTDEEIKEKFILLASNTVSKTKANKIVSTIDTLETTRSIRSLAELF
ncbi:MAG: MmgE/PrpD family protein [Deltaproteobacteria bacterium]|nr:MmgE/PrpD family protein [Deltaproteobacteria bacterium]